MTNMLLHADIPAIIPALIPDAITADIPVVTKAPPIDPGDTTQWWHKY